ncbi:MAG: hemolysin family protein [Candidatus Heimdallarchaeota archaeon]|nr:hemolysin family protein [Candidatus Heimdallarchaeota archaeon]MDH5644890.1 hemolysin family protein [Candidatus Heimdallarchaeota archaeon]
MNHGIILTILTYILATILLILINGFFVTAEFSLLRVRKNRLEPYYEKNTWGVKKLEKILDDLNFYITSAQIGITASTITMGIIIYPVLYNSLLSVLGFIKIGGLVMGLSIFFSFIIIVTSQTVLAEITPKIIAFESIEPIAIFVAPFHYYISILFKPLTILMRGLAFMVLRLIRFKSIKEVYVRVYSEDELKMLIAQSQKEGEIEESDVILMNQVFEFSDKTVNEIFTPRYEIVAFDWNTSVDTIISQAKSTGYSRFPLFDGNLDKIKGFIHIKDILVSEYQEPSFKIKDIIRSVSIIHEEMRLYDLLRKLQKEKLQVAVVVDEYGAVEGIVTIEDLIEAIVGPIDDEFDINSVDLLTKITPNKYLVDGRMNLDIFNRVFSCKLTAEDSVTIGGFILEHLETIPEEGTSFVHEGKKNKMIFTVNKMEGNRIEQAEIHLKRTTP